MDHGFLIWNKPLNFREENMNILSYWLFLKAHRKAKVIYCLFDKKNIISDKPLKLTWKTSGSRKDAELHIFAKIYLVQMNASVNARTCEDVASKGL